MLPVPPTVGFDDQETPSRVVRRGRGPSNHREELARWFDERARDALPAPLKAVGTSDATPGSARIPFLIF